MCILFTVQQCIASHGVYMCKIVHGRTPFFQNFKSYALNVVGRNCFKTSIKKEKPWSSKFSSLLPAEVWRSAEFWQVKLNLPLVFAALRSRISLSVSSLSWYVCMCWGVCAWWKWDDGNEGSGQEMLDLKMLPNGKWLFLDFFHNCLLIQTWSIKKKVSISIF